MSAKRSKAGRLAVVSVAARHSRRSSHETGLGSISGNAKLRSAMSAKTTPSGNGYLCAIEKNQNGKYDVRIWAVFGRDGWKLPVYFLASSFNAAMKKLEESLQVLQKNEEQLRFWGLERTDDPTLAGDLLKEFGLGLDRRRDLPLRVAELGVPRDRPVRASRLATVRRFLASSVSQERVVALAGD